MKKSLAIILSLILAVLFIVSCSSSGEAPKSDSLWSGIAIGGDSKNDSTPAEPPMFINPGDAEPGDAGTSSAGNSGSGTAGAGMIPITGPTGQSWAEKIIYTVNADIETLDYEATIQAVYDIMALNEAFIENANVGGVNLEQSRYDRRPMRQASFSIRVPVYRLNALTASLESLGNITNLKSSADNITAQFSDTESMLTSLRIQEERLLDMLSKAVKIEEMLDIEDRLAGIRYKVEGLTRALRDWQNQADYSTVNLFVKEVEVYTEPVVVVEDEPELTYWQNIGEGISESARGVARFFMAIFSWVVINLPVLSVLAVITFVIIVIVRRNIRRGREKRAARAQYEPQVQNMPYGQGNAYPTNNQYPRSGMFAPPSSNNVQNTSQPSGVRDSLADQKPEKAQEGGQKDDKADS